MRENVRAFVEVAASVLDLQGPVYEFGSFQVAGQEHIADLRDCFPGQEYVGCDLRIGPGVDRREDLSRLTLPDNSVGTILCVETLEHVFEVRKAVDEMIRVLAPGGTMIITTPMNFHIHEYPGDYWRITPGCLARLLSPLPVTLVGSQGVEAHPHTVLGVACKPPVSKEKMESLSGLISAFDQWLAGAEAALPWSRKLKRALVAPVRSRGERRQMYEHFASRFSLHVGGSADVALETVLEAAGPARLESR